MSPKSQREGRAGDYVYARGVRFKGEPVPGEIHGILLHDHDQNNTIYAPARGLFLSVNSWELDLERLAGAGKEILLEVGCRDMGGYFTRPEGFSAQAEEGRTPKEKSPEPDRDPEP